MFHTYVAVYHTLFTDINRFEAILIDEMWFIYLFCKCTLISTDVASEWIHIETSSSDDYSAVPSQSPQNLWEQTKWWNSPNVPVLWGECPRLHSDNLQTSRPTVKMSELFGYWLIDYEPHTQKTGHVAACVLVVTHEHRIHGCFRLSSNSCTF